MFENKVKTLLAEGKPAWGAGLPDQSDFIAKLTVDTGIDFLWIDTEHRPYDATDIPWIPVLCRMKGCVPIVRVAGLDPQLIKKALDVGAAGVMLPQINNAEEARRAVQYAKYPPDGTRGVSPWWTFFMDVSYEDYLPAANQETCVIVQIESREAIDNLEEIAAVEGVDVLFAGPLDISAALGHIGQVEHPEIQGFLEEFPRRAARCGKASGITLRGFEAGKKAYDAGYRFIVIGGLIIQGIAGLKADLERLRAYAHEPAASDAQGEPSRGESPV